MAGMNTKNRFGASVKMMGVATLFLSGAAWAEPSALVEDISVDRDDVQLMDYLEPGQTVELGPTDTLVLGYFTSCIQETITGGTVTIGEDESTVSGGSVQTDQFDCDGGPVIAQAGAEEGAGAAAFRAGSGKSYPTPDRLIFGLSPIIRLSEQASSVKIERLDADMAEVVIPSNGRVVDTAQSGVVLEPGGVYRVLAGSRAIVFKVSRLAEADVSSKNARLLPL